MTPLHTVGDGLRQLLTGIPLPAVRLLFLAVPVVLLLWVLRLPREETTPSANRPPWDENLKLWAGLTLLIQIVVYSIF